MTAVLLPITRFFLGVCLFMAALGFIATMWPLPGVDESDLPGAVADLEESAPVTSARDIDLVRQRPLFHENRRRPVEIETPEVAPAAPRRVVMPFELVGVMGTSNAGRSAYLFDKNTQETVSAKVGEKVGDWEITDISATTVTLEMGGIKRTLDMAGGG